jgi:hypothetical protein
MNGTTAIAGKTLQRKIDSQLPPKEPIETVLPRTANLKRSDRMKGDCGPQHQYNPLLGEFGQGDSAFQSFFNTVRNEIVLTLGMKLVWLVCSMYSPKYVVHAWD